MLWERVCIVDMCLCKQRDVMVMPLCSHTVSRTRKMTMRKCGNDSSRQPTVVRDSRHVVLRSSALPSDQASL